MKKINFNKSWFFTLDQNIDAFSGFGFEKYSAATGAATRFYDHNNWDRIDLPHDWAVALPKDLAANTFAGARANSHFHRFMTEHHNDIEDVYNVGWYRKHFSFDPDWKGKRIFVEFEGIFRDAIVWVNGVYMDRHNSGYTSFLLEITDHLVEGTENSIAVRVDSDQAEGWWYEGSGIYRNVNLIVCEPTYFQYNQTVVKTDLDGHVSASAVLVNDKGDPCDADVTWEILDSNGHVVAKETTPCKIDAYDEAKIAVELKVDEPLLWSVEAPNLYTLRLTLGKEIETVTFGIRTVAFDPDRGFLLNGKPCKIRGACVHQDFGGVGVALTDNLQYYKIQRLKDMGVNAYRCSHNAPAPALLRACDELGMLVMDETRMFGTSNEAIRQMTAVIERDRNHPCVFIWSLGNEEFSVQNLEWSAHLMTKMSRLAKKLDDTRPVTYSGNNGANFTGANSVAEIRGINYLGCSRSLTGDWTDQYHQDHPHQPMIGTEESSYVLSRGGAKNDLGSSMLDATGDVRMSWGSTPKGWVKFFEMRPYLAGSFMWTGFDYRGEPNPFITANVSSSFGAIDLCGMEKPPFYYYKAWWTDEPVLKLAPHWNHKEGETVKMAVFTNCEEITLFVNGRKIESKRVERFDAPQFTIPFEAGVIEIEGVKDGKIYRDTCQTSQKTAQVVCKSVLSAKDDADIAIYQLEAYDKDGVFCPTAGEKVEIEIEGGELVGVGNGDPASLDYDQKPREEEAIYLRTFSYEKGLYSVPLKTPNLHRRRYDYLSDEECRAGYEDDCRLVAEFKDDLAEPQTLTFTTTVRDVENFEYLEFERLSGKATVYLNGEELGSTVPKCRTEHNSIRPYRFYCDFAQGDNEIKIVTILNESDPLPISGEVKIGREVKDTPWQVRFHYGLARVFVKSNTPNEVKLSLRLKK